MLEGQHYRIITPAHVVCGRVERVQDGMVVLDGGEVVAVAQVCVAYPYDPERAPVVYAV